VDNHHAQTGTLRTPGISFTSAMFRAVNQLI